MRAKGLDEQHAPPRLIVWRRALAGGMAMIADLAEDTACYRRALDLNREFGGRWATAETLDHLGDTYHAAGDLAGALTEWEEALAILDDLQHPAADQIRAKLATLGPAPVERLAPGGG